MAALKVHGIPGSPFVGAVLWLLAERGVTPEFVALSPEALQTEPYLSLHPFSRVPVIEHGDFVLYETQAILRYIAEAFPGPALEPADARGRARMNQMIGINDWYLFPKAASVLVFERIVKPMLLGQPTDEEAAAASVPLVQRALGALARMQQGPYLLGDTPTLADFLIAPQVHYLAMTKEGAAFVSQHAGLKSWLALMLSRKSAAQSMLMGVPA